MVQSGTSNIKVLGSIFLISKNVVVLGRPIHFRTHPFSIPFDDLDSEKKKITTKGLNLRFSHKTMRQK